MTRSFATRGNQSKQTTTRAGVMGVTRRGLDASCQKLDCYRGWTVTRPASGWGPDVGSVRRRAWAGTRRVGDCPPDVGSVRPRAWPGTRRVGDCPPDVASVRLRVFSGTRRVGSRTPDVWAGAPWDGTARHRAHAPRPQAGISRNRDGTTRNRDGVPRHGDGTLRHRDDTPTTRGRGQPPRALDAGCTATQPLPRI